MIQILTLYVYGQEKDDDPDTGAVWFEPHLIFIEVLCQEELSVNLFLFIKITNKGCLGCYQ